MGVPQAIANDPQALRRLMRDLVAFTALPAVWMHLDAQQVIDSAAETMVNALGLDFVLISVRDGSQVREALRLTRGQEAQRDRLRAELAPLAESANANTNQSIAHPNGRGQMRTAVQLLAAPDDAGVVIAGAGRPDFPTEAERLLLNVGSNQAAIVLRQKGSERAVRESEARFRSFSDAAPVGIFSADAAGKFTYTNPCSQLLCGFTAAQGLGLGWLDYVHPDERAGVRERWLTDVRAGVEFHGQFQVGRPDSDMRWVDARAVAMLGETGQVLNYLGTLVDVSAQVEAEAELERRVNARTAELQEANAALRAEMEQRARAVESVNESEERFQLLVERVVDYAIFLLDTGGHVQSWNAGAERLKQYGAKEIIGQHFSRFYTAEDVALGKPSRLLARAEAEGHIVDEGWRVRKDGSRFWAVVVLTALRDRQGQLRGFAKVTRDMTERRRAEEELEQSNQRLRQLSAHVQTAREEERTTIARELHDELGQILTVAKVDLLRLLKRLGSEGESEPLPAARAEAELREVVQVIDESIKSTRRIMQRLRPQLLDELGLVAALEVQAEQFAERTGIACVLEASPEGMMPAPATAIVLYRIVQEALTNVTRHAGASQVRIQLAQEGPELSLLIEDNGRGITEMEMDKAGHFGLLGMKERAALLGGAVTITGAPGQGTRIHVRMPDA